MWCLLFSNFFCFSLSTLIHQFSNLHRNPPCSRLLSPGARSSEAVAARRAAAPTVITTAIAALTLIAAAVLPVAAAIAVGRRAALATAPAIVVTAVGGVLFQAHMHDRNRQVCYSAAA